MSLSNDDFRRLDQFPEAVRLLRCRRTGRYFNGDGWSEDPDNAQPFSDEVDAARACVTHNLRQVELVLRTKISHTEIFSTPMR